MITYIYYTFLRPFTEVWRTPDKAKLANRELAEAECKLLEAQSGRDYANAMVRYEQARVTRLTKMLHPKETTKELANDRPSARPSVQRVH